MGFRENLLKKIEVEKLADKVTANVMNQVDASRFDKQSARRLLELGGFPKVELDDRDLELYILKTDGEKKEMIVLDNGLAIYDTTIDDVALRKSPTVKEMISLRNAKRILSDEDVRVSKRVDSVRTIEKMVLDEIDLTYTEEDIAEIALDGAVSLESGYADGVLENLSLFSEILGFKKAPVLYQSAHCEIHGEVGKGPAGETQFGPAAIYDNANDSVRFIASVVDSSRKDDLIYYGMILEDEVEADAEGIQVFKQLQKLVMDRKPNLS